MAYSVKLKNQTGTEVPYGSIEQVAIPLSSGSGNVTFLAAYTVSKTAVANITYDGGDTAANSVDYMCRISTGSTGKTVPTSISVSIGGSVATAGTAYTYTKLSSTEAIVKVKGSYITGAVTISANPV